jgi:hypothetical protein
MSGPGASDIDPLEFHYRFDFDNGTTSDYTVRLDEHTLGLLLEPRTHLPDWTKLEYMQCPNCPLKPEEHAHCPVAANIAYIVEEHKNTPSTTNADIKITTATRRFAKRAPISDGLSAMLGLHMVSSGCPILDKFRPMARMHLPFATHEETMYRVVSMYLLAQYFQKQNDEDTDWELNGLSSLLGEIRDVNRSFCDRLKEVCTMDAILNAMVLLDCYAGITSLELKSRELPHIRKIFSAFLNPRASSAKSQT